MRVHHLDNNVKKKSCELQACLRFTMRLSRWAGFFPVQGLDQLVPAGLTYKVKCVYGIYHMITVIGLTVMFCLSLFWFLNDVSLGTLSMVVFFGSSLISAMLLVKLAKQWQALMQRAKDYEDTLTLLEFDKYAALQSEIMVGAIMVLGLVEHVLNINFNLTLIMDYLEQTTITNNVIEVFVTHRLPQIFNYISYTHFRGVVTQFLYLQATFIWSFNDALTICVSIFITSLLQKLNKMIRSKKNNSGVPWGQLREHFSQIAMVTKETDDQINFFILLSSFINLFYICLQLFHSLRFASSFYYLFSFGFMMFRALSMFLYASNVHATAQEPVMSVINIPSSDYGQEVKMFQLQLRFTNVGLTGRYFYVTRTMVLQVIGTIITYELVLLQFITNPNHLLVNLSGLHKNNNYNKNLTN